MVTPTSVTATRTDVGTTRTTTDTDFRGGYFQIGRNGITGTFTHPTIT